MIRWVVDLEDTAAADPAVVGGKAAALHRLTDVRLPVPRATIVTTHAFRTHFPAATPHQRPAALELHPNLTAALEDALRRNFEPGARLAVRSSAVGEDSAEASFAGQHATYYHVTPDAVGRSVIDCWLSLWSATAHAYRSAHGATSDFAMAVIIQRMVAADRSGVCFTADPTGAHPGQTVIEAAWGLGAALVDGRVSPDRLILSRDGRVLQHHVARKRHRVVDAPGATRLEPVPLADQARPVLCEAQAAEVLQISLQIEALFGAPQDVEWSYEDGRLQLLQSRPITSMEPAAASPGTTADVSGSWILFKPLAENFTDPLTPMTVDLFRRVLPPLGRFIDGRYYVSLDLMRRLSPFRWTLEELADVMLLRGPVPRLHWRWRRLPLAAAGLAAAYLADGIGWHRSAHVTRQGLAAYEHLCQRLSLDRTVDAADGLFRLVLGRPPFEPIGRMAYYVNVSAGRYFLLLGVLDKLVERWAPGFDRARLRALSSGDGGTFSRQLVEGVRRLAETAAGDQALTARLTAADAPQIAEAVAALPEEHPFAGALAAFLDTFGHRCLREMELAVPRWREDPLPVLLMVRSHLRSPAPPAADPHARQLLARHDLREALPQGWQRRLADYLIGRIRHYTSLREDTRHYHAMAMDVTRSKLLDLEQGLLADGRLRLTGDIFYLRWHEARQLANGRLDWQDIARTVRVRRRRHRMRSRVRAPEIVGTLAATGSRTTALRTTAWRTTATARVTAAPGGAPGVANGSREAGHVGAAALAGDDTGEVICGQCASPGTAEGRVRIVLDPAAANDLAAGDVLVAPYTDPAWTPLFPLAAAIVVEVGSFLSHAGTVAREYGIPCLVDVEGCTRRLRDGQRVRVHASEGRLEVLEP